MKQIDSFIESFLLRKSCFESKLIKKRATRRKSELLEGSIAKRLAYLLSDPAALGLIPSIPEFFSKEKNVDVAEVNQWLENVY